MPEPQARPDRFVCKEMSVRRGRAGLLSYRA